MLNDASVRQLVVVVLSQPATFSALRFITVDNHNLTFKSQFVTIFTAANTICVVRFVQRYARVTKSHDVAVGKAYSHGLKFVWLLQPFVERFRWRKFLSGVKHFTSAMPRG